MNDVLLLAAIAAKERSLIEASKPTSSKGEVGPL
jgi:hypothetical protein